MVTKLAMAFPVASTHGPLRHHQQGRFRSRPQSWCVDHKGQTQALCGQKITVLHDQILMELLSFDLRLEQNTPKLLRSSNMQTEQIVSMLIAERDRLSKAIEALQGPTKRRGRPPKNPVAEISVSPASAVVNAAPVKRKHAMNAEVRARMAAGQKRRWAAIRAGKAASPFAKKKG